MSSPDSVQVNTWIDQYGLVLFLGEIAFQCDRRARDLAAQQHTAASIPWLKAATDIAHLAKTAEGWPEWIAVGVTGEGCSAFPVGESGCVWAPGSGGRSPDCWPDPVGLGTLRINGPLVEVERKVETIEFVNGRRVRDGDDGDRRGSNSGSHW